MRVWWHWYWGSIVVGKRYEGVSGTVLKEVGECVMHWTGKWWQRSCSMAS